MWLYIYGVMQMLFGYFLAYIFISIFFISINPYTLILKRTKIRKIKYDNDYYRDILKHSPSEIFYIYNKNFVNDGKDKVWKMQKFRKLFLINLLKMDLLNYIDIDFKNKDNLLITKKDNLVLDDEYKLIYDCLFSRITWDAKIYLYDIYDFVNENIDDQFFETWENCIQNKLHKNKFYRGNIISLYGNKIKYYYLVNIPIISYIVIGNFNNSISDGFGMLWLCLGLLLIGFVEALNHKVLSEYGKLEYQKIKALEKFLKDFSKIDEKDLEYSLILEDYIVYAIIFDKIKTKPYINNLRADVRQRINERKKFGLK